MDTAIQHQLKQVRDSIPENVTLVAVSKFHPIEALQEAYEAGQRVFGESKVQELTGKYEAMDKDIQWHFIGHLQTNKVKYITPFISMIHSVDSLKLLKEIDSGAAKNNRVIDVLLQIHIANEETKYGFTPEECKQMLAQNPISDFKNVRICGLMGMATFTDDEQQIRREFKTLTNLYSELKNTVFADAQYFRELSFGMSDDYKIAIEEGSTMVRVGSSIFGTRDYNL